MLVRIFEKDENNLARYLATNVLSYGNEKCICMTFNKKTKKNKVHCQKAYNKPKLLMILKK